MKPIETEEENIKQQIHLMQMIHEGVGKGSEEEECKLLKELIFKYEWQRWPELKNSGYDVLVMVDGLHEGLERKIKEMGLNHLLPPFHEDYAAWA